MDGAGSSSGDVSTTATEEVPLADHELLQLNAWLPMGPTENFLQLIARVYNGRVLSRLPLGGPNTGRSAIVFESTRSADGDDGGDDDDDPRHSDADADNDDAYGGGFGFSSFGAVPASGVAIACLPETTARDRHSGRCAVCLEEYEAGDALRTMPCAHGFHECCIFGWLRASRLCPLCRLPLPAEEEEEEEEDMATDVELASTR